MLYIYQFPDWTNFTFNSKRVLDALGKVRYKEGHLAGLLEACGSKEFDDATLAEEIVANYAIDNHKLDTDEVIKDIAGQAHGMAVVKSYLNMVASPAKEFTHERLLLWHTAMRHTRTHKFRDATSSVTACDGELSFVGPGAERLAAEMDRFFRWIENDSSDSAIKAAIAHFWFLTLRPFDDRNGRIARLISTALLCQDKPQTNLQYALSSQILARRDEYLRILNKTQCGSGDLTEWILWFLAQIENAVQASEEKISPQARRAKFMGKHSGIPTDERAQILVDAVMKGNIPAEFTTGDVAKVLGTSHDTALREIQSLVKKGILKSGKKGGRSQRYSVVD